MHDAKGRELHVGDSVLIPCVITDLQAFEEYCNVTVETKLGRRPDGLKEKFYSFNTGVVLRSLPGDDNTGEL